MTILLHIVALDVDSPLHCSFERQEITSQDVFLCYKGSIVNSAVERNQQLRRAERHLFFQYPRNATVCHWPYNDKEYML